MKKEQFEVGQTIWFSMEHHRRVNGKLMEGTVSKVGNKYVTVNDRYRFSLENGKLKDLDGKLYLNDQDFHDEIEIEEDYQYIRNRFNYPSDKDNPVTLAQTRAIRNILES